MRTHIKVKKIGSKIANDSVRNLKTSLSHGNVLEAKELGDSLVEIERRLFTCKQLL